MCWGSGLTITMAGAGAVAAGVLAWRGESRGIWVTLGYFSFMEALQAAGYSVADNCGSPANRSVTLLSYLHIVFQPFFINAFAMELLPEPVRMRLRRGVFLCCALSSLVMLTQLMPLSWAGTCQPGAPLCASELCLVRGEWHIAWNVPYNGLLIPLEDAIGVHAGFPSYMLVAFLLPIVYGAWRFVLFHALAGPVLASFLTNNPNEQPAIWCLFSIGILLMSLSPLVRSRFETSEWWAWPRSWQV